MLDSTSSFSNVNVGYQIVKKGLHLRTRTYICIHHRWALSPISVISDIGLSLISELPISDWESGVRHYIGYRNTVLFDVQYPTSQFIWTGTVAQWYCAQFPFQGAWVPSCRNIYFFSSISDIGMSCDVDIGTLSISEHCRYRNTFDIRMTFFSPTYLSSISE